MTTRILSIVTTADPLTRQLSDLVKQLRVLALPEGWQLELVVVDDLGFWPDGTQATAELSLWTSPALSCRLVWYPEKRGQLAALAAGAAQASGEAILTIDPDLHCCCSCIPSLLSLYNQGAPILHGARRGRRDIALVRRLGSGLVNILVRYLSGIRVPDLGSPLMLFPAALRGELQQAMEAGAHPRLYLYHMYQEVLKVVPVETSAVPPHTSHYRLADLCRTALALLRQCIVTRRHCRRMARLSIKIAES